PRRFDEIRVFRRGAGGLARATGEIAKTLRVDSVPHRGSGPAPAEDAQEGGDVIDQGRLVDLRAGKACEARALGLNDRLRSVALGRGDGLRCKLERVGHDVATPTWTSRKRAGAAPSLTSARRSSRAPSPGSRWRLVMRTSGIRLQPSARIDPPLPPPSFAAVSRELRKLRKTPPSTTGFGSAGTPSSS